MGRPVRGLSGDIVGSRRHADEQVLLSRDAAAKGIIGRENSKSEACKSLAWGCGWAWGTDARPQVGRRVRSRPEGWQVVFCLLLDSVLKHGEKTHVPLMSR